VQEWDRDAGAGALPAGRRRVADRALVVVDDHRRAPHRRLTAGRAGHVERNAGRGRGQEGTDLEEHLAALVPLRDAAVVGLDQVDRALEQRLQ
jgi:hypothetical protein